MKYALISIGRWPTHHPQRITMRRKKLCPVHRSFTAMSGVGHSDP